MQVTKPDWEKVLNKHLEVVTGDAELPSAVVSSVLPLMRQSAERARSHLLDILNNNNTNGRCSPHD